MGAVPLPANCPLLSSRGRPFVIGTVGTSISYGVGVDPAAAWPRVLEAKLRRRFGQGVVAVANGAVRASTADFAALCWDAIWGRAGYHNRAPPQLDLVVIEYTKSSTTWQLEMLLEKLVAMRLPLLAMVTRATFLPQPRSTPLSTIPVLAVQLWHHAPCGLPKRLRATCISPRELQEYRRLFRRYGVPFVNNRCAPDSLGGYAFSEGRYLHPSAAAHEVVADEVAAWVEARCHRGSLPLPAPHGDVGAAPRQECRIGAGLAPLAAASDGFSMFDEGIGRPSGFAASRQGARLVLRLSMATEGAAGKGASGGAGRPWQKGFVSLGLEFSWRDDAVARLRCVQGCECEESAVSVQTDRQWTITSHSKPRFATLDASGQCHVEVVVQNRTKGRLMVTAATLAHPLLGTHSVATQALHWLPDISG